MFINFDNVSIGYNARPILPPLSIEIEKGDFWGIVGPNGSGKTTFVRTLLGIAKPVAGKIAGPVNLKFGYVPQRDSLDLLFPFSVRDIVEMAQYRRCSFFRKIDYAMVNETLERLGIADVAGKMFKELSGGQKQRTLIARALAGNPDVLVLDEPTNGMDIRAEKSIMDSLSRLNSDGLTVIMVAHQLNLVASYSKNVVILGDRVFSGSVSELVTRELLSEVYGCSIEVFSDAGGRRTIAAV